MSASRKSKANCQSIIKPCIAIYSIFKMKDILKSATSMEKSADPSCRISGKKIEYRKANPNHPCCSESDLGSLFCVFSRIQTTLQAIKRTSVFFHAPFPDGGMTRLVSAFRFLLLGANNAGVRQKLRNPFLTARRFVILF